MRRLAELRNPHLRMPTTCPGCGTRGKLLPILYGEHSREAEEQARQGRVVLGVASEHEGPRFECLVCGSKLK